MASVADRKNKQVWDAIESENWKQALQLCAKRMKKGEKSDYLSALKTYIQIRFPSSTQKEEGFAELKSHINKDPPTVDLDTLNLLQQCLSELEESQFPDVVLQDVKALSALLWERAIKAKPGDEQLARQWFFSAFQHQNWRDAQKAAMGLQRSFAQKREYYFWAILACHMLHLSPDSSEADRKLFGTLAYRMASKAASAVPTDPEALLSPGRSIQTPQELHLLLSIYRRQGHDHEGLDVLNSPSLGIWSTAAKGDWSFVRKKLDLLGRLEFWREMWDFCKSLLEKSLPAARETSNGDPKAIGFYGDDWRVWQSLLLSNDKLQDDEIQKGTRALLLTFVEQTPKSRNANLALLGFLESEYTANPTQPEALKVFAQACHSYFEDSASKMCCFDDLRSHVERLDATSQDRFLDYITEFAKSMSSKEDANQMDRANRAMTQINSQKFHFLIRISLRGQHLQDNSMAEFISDCIRLYSSTFPFDGDIIVTDNRVGDDACVLAVMGLIHWSARNDSKHAKGPSIKLFQATALLEHLLSRSKHDYQALMIQVRLQGLLGAGSLQAETYSRLAVKQIQNDTLAYNKLCRISTLHPHPIANSLGTSMEPADLDAFAGLKRALGIYNKSESQVPDLCRKALEHGSYDQIEGFQEFGLRVEKSICKVFWTMERRRIARLLRPLPSTSHLPDSGVLESSASNLTDNRDNELLVDWKASSLPHFEEGIRVGPQPGGEWVKAFQISEKIFEEILSSPEGKRTQESMKVAADPEALRKIIISEIAPKEMTESELSYLGFATSVAEMLQIIRRGQQEKICEDSLKFDDIQRWLKAKADPTSDEDALRRLQAMKLGRSPQILGWQSFHETYLVLDALIEAKGLLQLARKRPNGAKPALIHATDSETDKLVNDVFQMIRSQTTQTKNALSESGVVGALVDAAFEREGEDQTLLGKSLEDMAGEGWMESYASKIIESWQEALDGILRVKIS